MTALRKPTLRHTHIERRYILMDISFALYSYGYIVPFRIALSATITFAYR